jgi:hypothetical protein
MLPAVPPPEAMILMWSAPSATSWRTTADRVCAVRDAVTPVEVTVAVGEGSATQQQSWTDEVASLNRLAHDECDAITTAVIAQRSHASGQMALQIGDGYQGHHLVRVERHLLVCPAVCGQREMRVRVDYPRQDGRFGKILDASGFELDGHLGGAANPGETRAVHHHDSVIEHARSCARDHPRGAQVAQAGPGAGLPVRKCRHVVSLGVRVHSNDGPRTSGQSSHGDGRCWTHWPGDLRNIRPRGGRAGRAGYSCRSSKGDSGPASGIRRSGHAVSPGLVTDAPMRTADAGLTPYMQMMLDMTPLGRTGAPADIAEVVVFVASQRNAWMTGSVVDISGGSHTGRPHVPLPRMPA